ncbi:MAG: FAD-dependent thymidylate synthase [Sphaerochaetaceae bacterium]|nr:FAD-dependent thymidylate synthase [Sphaerochaetaceae bacterium]
MAHSISEAAEEILDKEYPVLDHGFVRLVDYCGNDDRIVQAARISYGAGTKSYRQDKGLINYLMRNDHSSPFEMVSFTFHVKMPIFVARQWVRHRTAKMNEISGRYSVMTDEVYRPDRAHINKQSENNRQGREDTMVNDEMAKDVMAKFDADHELIFNNYHEMLDNGIARELSRIDLPLSMYTEMYWSMDLRNLFHFLKLRCDGHAQYEIQEYANTILDIVEKVCPIATDAFKNHSMNAVSFSEKETEALKEMLSGKECPLKGRQKEIFEEKLK